MTNEQRNEVIKQMLDEWKHMTTDEQEQLCCTTGTITLFENAITKFNIPDNDATQEDCDYCMQEFNKYAWEDDNHSTGINNYSERLDEAYNKLGPIRGSVAFALWCIIDELRDAGDGDISISDDTIGINITNNSIDIVDIEENKSIITFYVR